MPATRALLVTGPARVVRGSGILYSQDDIAVNINQTTTPIATMSHGHIDERAESVTVEATFTPEGRWDSATRSLLWPYADTLPGSSVFGSSDTATVFHGSDGATNTIEASAITRMPSIFLSAAKTMVGPVTIGGVRKTGIAWSTAGSLFGIGTGATFEDTTFNRGLIKVQDYTGVISGQTGFDAIKTQDGWTIDFDLQLDPISTDDIGVVDFRYRSLQVTARCMPVDPLPSEILAELLIQDTGAARGRSLARAVSSEKDLVITGADATTIITLKHVGLRTAGFRFGASVLREGEIAFVAARPFTTGAGQPMFTLA